MLRKNMGVVGISGSKQVSVQTQQFLWALPLQEKILKIYQQYSQLKEQLKKCQDLLEYTQYKNHLLHNSLHELTYTFTTERNQQNIHTLNDIQALDEQIVRESQELEQNLVESILNTDKSRSESYSVSQTISEQQRGKETLEQQPQEGCLSQRNNLCILNKTKQIKNKQPISSQSNNHRQRTLEPTYRNRYRKNGKQNVSVLEMTKKEAELNLKVFLNQFHRRTLPIPL